VVCAVLIEFRRDVTAVAVKNKEPIATKRTISYILIEYILELLEAYLVGCLAVFAYTDCLIRWYKPVFVPSCLVHYRLEDDEWWDRKTSRADSLNYRYPFTVPWLYCPRSPCPIRTRNNFRCRDYPHLEASLVEIIRIVIEYTVLSFRTLYAFKPGSNKYWVFALRTLVVVLAVTL
jgi:hypothetical protein